MGIFMGYIMGIFSLHLAGRLLKYLRVNCFGTTMRARRARKLPL